MNPQRRSGSGSLPAGPPPAGRDRGGSGDLRRLKIVGVVLPIAFVIALELIRFRVVEKDVAHFQASAHYGAYFLLVAATVVAVIGFSLVMFHFIDRAQDETAQLVANLRRRQQEGHGFYDVLLRISNQNALADILAAVARHARDLVGGDDAVVCLSDATTRSVQFDLTLSGMAALREGVCISPEADGSLGLHDHRVDCPARTSPAFSEKLRSPIQSRDIVFGDLWIGREAADPFSDRDLQFLSTLSDLASIAVTSARMRENERQSAILAERERIAREMHDSLAQVLGLTHLRLRALGSREDVRNTPTTATELSELADICEEAYHDVREAILDLREASRTDRGLLDGLRAYLDKYSHQSGISTTLEIAPGSDLVLAPDSEIQIIRVIQESLTNVRKHSGATSAVVRITETDGKATFVVEDDGRGFDMSEAPLDRDSFGLHSMRQRIELIRGTLRVDSEPGRGTRVIAEIPYIAASAPKLVEIDGAGN